MYIVPREALDLQDEDKYVRRYTDKMFWSSSFAVNIPISHYFLEHRLHFIKQLGMVTGEFVKYWLKQMPRCSEQIIK